MAGGLREDVRGRRRADRHRRDGQQSGELREPDDGGAPVPRQCLAADRVGLRAPGLDRSQPPQPRQRHVRAGVAQSRGDLERRRDRLVGLVTSALLVECGGEVEVGGDRVLRVVDHRQRLPRALLTLRRPTRHEQGDLPGGQAVPQHRPVATRPGQLQGVQPALVGRPEVGGHVLLEPEGAVQPCPQGRVVDVRQALLDRRDGSRVALTHLPPVPDARAPVRAGRLRHPRVVALELCLAHGDLQGPQHAVQVTDPLAGRRVASNRRCRRPGSWLTASRSRSSVRSHSEAASS